MMMKKFLAFVLVGLITACGSFPGKPVPPQKPCPTCPGQTPCPEPVPCPPGQPCPPCPECPSPPPPPPVPPPPPSYPDVGHAASEFEITAILAAPKTMGLYVSDPNGNYGYAVFTMPELHQKDNYEEVLTLNGPQEKTYDVGAVEAKDDELGLVVAGLCDREYAPVCNAVITTNGPDVKHLAITMTQDPNAVFQWDAK